MTLAKTLAIAAMAILTVTSVEAATLYECKGKASKKEPDKSTLALAVLDSSGEAVAMDAWSHDKKKPDNFWDAEVKRNDSQVLDLRWVTGMQRARNGGYLRLRVQLTVQKSDMSFKLGLTGADVHEQQLTGTCMTSTVKDFTGG